MDDTEALLCSFQGERDYRALKGPTGPLVYPAGFLYFYTVLYWLSGGGNIPSAQAAFVVLYLLTQVSGKFSFQAGLVGLLGSMCQL